MAERDDWLAAHRLAGLPSLFRHVDEAGAVRDIAADANHREWLDCLELFGSASCDRRGVIRMWEA